MFTENTEFRVTIRDFQDRVEPQVLKHAGNVFLRAVREASADYLENSLDPDAELIWTVTMHPELNVGTIHYVVCRETEQLEQDRTFSTYTLEGKCLVWDLSIEPRPDRPWHPIVMAPGTLRGGYVLSEISASGQKGVFQPELREFNNYSFQGWIPVNRLTGDMIARDPHWALVGAGFPPDFVYDMKMNRGPDNAQLDVLEALKVMDDKVGLEVKRFKEEEPDSKFQVAKKYQFDVRPLQHSVAMKLEYVLRNVTHGEGFEVGPLLTYVTQSGGWMEGHFIQYPKQPINHLYRPVKLDGIGQDDSVAYLLLKSHLDLVDTALESFVSDRIILPGYIPEDGDLSPIITAIRNHYIEKYVSDNASEFPSGLKTASEILAWCETQKVKHATIHEVLQ